MTRVVALALAVALGEAIACSPPEPQARPIVVPAQPSSAPAVVTADAAAPVAAAVATAAKAPELPPFDPPAPPPVQPLDPKLPVDGSVLLLGYDAKSAWVLAERATVVVDRASGCATESYVEPKALDRILKVATDEEAEAALASLDVVKAIRELAGLGLRFGLRTQWLLHRFVWSPDGRHVFVEAAHRLYHSSDGGKTYARVDDHAASRHAMTSDGKHVLYERCIRKDCSTGVAFVSLPTDRSRGPVAFTKGLTMLLETTDDGRARFWRSEADECLDTFDLVTPARTSSVCVPIPPQADKMWATRQWQSVSPSGRYGVVKWEEARSRRPGGPAGLTYVVPLVEMSTQKILKTVLDVDAFVDDAGNMVTRSMAEGGGDLTQYHPLQGQPKTLGRTSVYAWDLKQKVAILAGPYRKANLGARKCDLLRFVPTP